MQPLHSRLSSFLAFLIPLTPIDFLTRPQIPARI